MEEKDAFFWNKALEIFSQVFGTGRVTKDDGGITLTFNLDDAKQQQQHHHLAKKLAELGIKNFSQTEVPPDKAIIDDVHGVKLEVYIPFQDNESRWIYSLAESVAWKADIRTEMRDNEKRRAVLQGDPAHCLAEHTNTKWVRVVDSPYGTDIVETSTKPRSDEQRKAQEFAAFQLFQDNSGINYSLVKDWQEHQSKVENGAPPRTALPADWVKRDKIRRIIEDKEKRSIQAAFRPEFVPQR